MEKKLKYGLRIAVGCLILAALTVKVGIHEITKTFLSIQLKWIFFGIPFFALTFFVSALNILILLKGYGSNVPFWQMFRWMLLSWANGQLIPGKVGEFSFVYFFSRSKRLKVGEGTALVLIDKLIVLSLYVVFSSMALFLFFPRYQALRFSIVILLLAALGIAVCVSKRGHNLIKKVFRPKLTKKFEGFGRVMGALLKNPKYIFANVSLNILKMLLFTAYFVLLFLSFHETVNTWHVFLLIALVSMISGIPVTISGLGVREGAAVFFYTKLGVPAESVMGTFLIFATMNYLLVGIIYPVLSHEFVQKIEKQNMDLLLKGERVTIQTP